MNPKKTTVEGEHEERMKGLCDEIVYRAGCMMLERVGAPMGMMLDRMLTFAAAHAVSSDGPTKAAAVFRQCADLIDAGVFHSQDGENLDGGSKH